MKKQKFIYYHIAKKKTPELNRKEEGEWENMTHPKFPDASSVGDIILSPYSSDTTPREEEEKLASTSVFIFVYFSSISVPINQTAHQDSKEKRKQTQQPKIY